MGTETPSDGEPPHFAIVESDKDNDDDTEATCQLFIGKKLRVSEQHTFNLGNVVVYLPPEGDTLGCHVSDLDKWLGCKATKGDSYSTQSNWIIWSVGDKTHQFGLKKLLAYVLLFENCHVIVILVKEEGWIPDLEVDWVKSWLVEFNHDMDDCKGLELFLRKVGGKPTKEFKAQMTLVKDKTGSHNKWELHMVGAVESKLLLIQHGDEAWCTLEVGIVEVEVVVKAQHRCLVSWDSTSSPGDHHLAAKCHFVQKANVAHIKHGMDLILIVKKMADLTIGEQLKLPLDVRISQLETENSTLRN
ncbi:hypothetical protein RSAG8_13111, partial [Rhizoctonia solani AG-8 WAC10335]